MTSEESLEGKDGRNNTLFMRRHVARCVYGCGKETVMSSHFPWLPCGHTRISSFLALHISHFPSLRFHFGRQIPKFHLQTSYGMNKKYPQYVSGAYDDVLWYFP